MSSQVRSTVAALAAMLAGIASLTTAPAWAQTVGCEPVAQRAGRKFGCFITARTDFGALPRDTALYWHIDAFPSESRATAAKAPRSTIVRSLGRVWLFTIGEESVITSGL